MEDGKPAKCCGQSGPPEEQAKTRRPAPSAVCRAKGPAATSLAETTPNWGLSTTARQKGMDTQTGQPGTQTVGHPTGGKSSRGNGRAPSHRTDFRANLR